MAALLLGPVSDRCPGALQSLAEAVQVEVFGALGQAVVLRSSPLRNSTRRGLARERSLPVNWLRRGRSSPWGVAPQNHADCITPIKVQWMKSAWVARNHR